MSVTLALDHLSFAYGRAEVLHDLNATVRTGAITAVIGPNASGKSTLLRCMIGALTPTRGQAILDGQSLRRQHPARVARRVAYVAQRSTVSATFTVRQVVELGRFALPASAPRVNQAIELLDLVDVAECPYRTLSAGQQQRVAIARAVAQHSGDGHLILDEPTSAMDLKHIQVCATLLRKLSHDGATIVVAMHDLTLASALADCVWLLHDGRLAASGDRDDVLTESRLQQVFGVEFEWISGQQGHRRLVPKALSARIESA